MCSVRRHIGEVVQVCTCSLLRGRPDIPDTSSLSCDSATTSSPKTPNARWRCQLFTTSNPEKRCLTYEQLKKPARNSDHNDQYQKKPCTHRVKFKVKPINHLEKKKRKRGSKREANGSHQRRARKNGSQSRTELMKIG
nr:PREDICTED: uncharacterized protein LOC105662166 isoform X1 [Megachile rotundata]